MATTDNFFQTSDGLWLYYEVHGEGRPIVMLPGFGEALTMWHHNVPQLSENHKVVCLDLRGHGRSMKVAGGNRQVRMAQDVREHLPVGMAELVPVGGDDIVVALDEVQELVARIVHAPVV